MGKEIVEGVTTSSMEIDDLMFTDAVPWLRYAPPSPNRAAICNLFA